MSIQHKKEGERARKGRTMSQIEEIGKLWQCKKVVENLKNHWSFKYNWQGFQKMD